MEGSIFIYFCAILCSWAGADFFLRVGIFNLSFKLKRKRKDDPLPPKHIFLSSRKKQPEVRVPF